MVCLRSRKSSEWGQQRECSKQPKLEGGDKEKESGGRGKRERNRERKVDGWNESNGSTSRLCNNFNHTWYCRRYGRLNNLYSSFAQLQCVKKGRREGGNKVPYNQLIFLFICFWQMLSVRRKHTVYLYELYDYLLSIKQDSCITRIYSVKNRSHQLASGIHLPRKCEKHLGKHKLFQQMFKIFCSLDNFWHWIESRFFLCLDNKTIKHEHNMLINKLWTNKGMCILSK